MSPLWGAQMQVEARRRMDQEDKTSRYWQARAEKAEAEVKHIKGNFAIEAEHDRVAIAEVKSAARTETIEKCIRVAVAEPDKMGILAALRALVPAQQSE